MRCSFMNNLFKKEMEDTNCIKSTIFYKKNQRIMAKTKRNEKKSKNLKNTEINYLIQIFFNETG